MKRSGKPCCGVDTTVRGTYDVLSGLNKVDGGSVPAESARASDEHGLALLGVENLAEHADAVAEHGDERRRDVRVAGGGIGVEDWAESATVRRRHSLWQDSENADIWERIKAVQRLMGARSTRVASTAPLGTMELHDRDPTATMRFSTQQQHPQSPPSTSTSNMLGST